MEQREFEYTSDITESLALQFFSGPKSLPFAVENIIGIGVDICNVPRVKEAVEKHPFYTGVIYTAEEIAYCEQARGSLRFERYAVRFAGKEAAAKAIGGIPHRFQDICILNADNGKPYVELRGRAKEWADQKRIADVFLSLSHLKEAAIAFCIAVRRSPY